MIRIFLGRIAVASALAAIFAIASAKPSLAQEKPAPAKAAPRPAASFLTGAVEALDQASGTLRVRSRKGVVKDFVADEKARGQLGTLGVGDKVVVKYLDGTALSIVKPGVKKKEASTGGTPPAGGKPAAPGARK